MSEREREADQARAPQWEGKGRVVEGGPCTPGGSAYVKVGELFTRFRAKPQIISRDKKKGIKELV